MPPRAHVAAVFIVLCIVTFLFDTRIGLLFLVAAIVTLYRGAPARRMSIVRGERPHRQQPAWKDPWGTGPSTGSKGV